MQTIKNNTKFRFVAVGVLNTAVDFGVLFLLTWLGVPRVVANIFSTTAAFITSFTANKKYTFRSTVENLKRQMTLFVGFTLFSIWVIQSSVIYFTSPVFESVLHNKDLALLFAKLAAVTCGLVWNYITYSRFVFNKKP